MEIEKTEIYGFMAALQGMRNPMNSWDKSDSKLYTNTYNVEKISYPEAYCIGPEDLKLANSLIISGPEHAKFLRQIQIWTNITIPRYIWQELDTYKISTVRNSCSTRPNTLKKQIFTQDCFEQPIPECFLNHLNNLIEQTKNKSLKERNDILRTIKNCLPEGFLQKATYSLNYQTALNMYHQRKNHWLQEWHIICSWIKSLPYMNIWCELKK